MTSGGSLVTPVFSQELEDMRGPVYNKDHGTLGSILGSHVYGNYHVRVLNTAFLLKRLKWLMTEIRQNCAQILTVTACPGALSV